MYSLLSLSLSRVIVQIQSQKTNTTPYMEIFSCFFLSSLMYKLLINAFVFTLIKAVIPIILSIICLLSKVHTNTIP